MVSEKLDEKHKLAEIEKLGLEIKSLKKADKKWYVLIQYLPLTTVLVALAGFIFGIIQYKDQQQKDRVIREKEFKIKYWEKQLDVYINISQSAARLATLDNAEDREKEYQRFRELYYGNFLMVADEQVARTAKTFFQNYIDYRNDPRKQVGVQLSSKALANACRKSLGQSWDVPLNNLDVSQF